MALVSTLPKDYNPHPAPRRKLSFSDIATFKFDGKQHGASLRW
jgi:hypothetical protein